MTTLGLATRGCRAVLVLISALALSGCLGNVVERRLNTVQAQPDAPKPNPAEVEFHKELFIVDLHADTLLWDRDLLAAAAFGHVDLLRLREGNVAIQVFEAVTQTPRKKAPEAPARLHPAATECIDADHIDYTTLLQFAQARPLSNWFDLEARALYQADRLKRFVRQSQTHYHAVSDGDPKTPYLKLIRSADDLEDLVEARLRHEEPVIGVILALEGAHWVGQDAANTWAIRKDVRRLSNAGFRMLAPTHRFNNALGAASEGCDQSLGLTPAGVAFLKHAEDLGIALDLAHLSDTATIEAAARREGPVVISHTGVRATCRKDAGCVVERNLTDDGIRAVARAGGIVGIGYWPEAVGRGVERIVDAFEHAFLVLSDPAFVAEMRADGRSYDPAAHLALGSDFDGSVETPFDIGDLPILTAALLRRQSQDGSPLFSKADLRRIAGANACYVFALRLPGGRPDRAEKICGPLLDSR